MDFLIEKKAVTGTTFQYRAWTLARLGKAEEARAELAKYLEQKSDPSIQAYVQIVLAAWLGDRADAAKQLDIAATLAGKNADALYHVACAAALAAQACEKADGEQAKQLAGRALELLTTAVTHGYQNAPQLRMDVDLAGLHADPRFVTLLEKLEPPARYAAVWRADYVPNASGEFAEGMKLAPNWLERTGYRLPTEGAWEYACRAGAGTRYSSGQAGELWGR